MSLTKNKFLIRSSREILGPYTKEEVIDLIKNGKISTFDEVSEPFEIWICLQDHKEFKAVVESMDMRTKITNFLTEISNKMTKTRKTEKTQTKTLDSQDTSTTKSYARTQTMTLTQKEKDSASEVDFNVSQTSAKKAEKDQYSSREENEEKIRRKIGFFVRLSWQAIIAFAVLIISFIAYQVVYKPMREKNEAAVGLNLKGEPFYEKGDYDGAFPYFERARGLGLLNDYQKLLYSSLLLKKNKLQKAFILANEISGSAVINSESGILLRALIDFYDQDYKKASKSFETVAFSKSDFSNKALINLAILNWEQKQYQKSIGQLNSLITQAFERDIVWYLKAVNLLYQNRWSDLEKYIKNELFFDQGAIVIEFKQELYLMLAYLEMRKKDTSRLKYYVLKFFNEDPFMYQNYSYHPLIAVNRLNWSYVFSYCRDIFNFNPDDNLLRALYAFCMFKMDQFDKADSELKRLRSAEPQNPLFLSLQAYFLMDKKIGQEEELEQIFSLINYNQLKKNNWLAFILKAYFLQSQMYWEASSEIWKDLLAFDPKHLSSLAGIGINSYQLKNPAEGSLYVQQALNKYPHHKKLIPYKK